MSSEGLYEVNVRTEQLAWGQRSVLLWRCVSTVSNFRMGQLGLARSAANVDEAEGNKECE